MKTRFKLPRFSLLPGMKKCFTAMILLSSMAGCRTIKPEGPMAQNPPDTAPVEQKISFATIPLQVNLEPVFAQANNTLERNWSRSENPCEGVRYSVNAAREDLNFNFTNSTLNVSTRILYGAKATYCAKCVFNNCVVPKVTASCGVDGEAQRIVRIGIASDLALSPDYRLNAHSRLTAFEPENRCRVFFFNFDVTDRIMEATRPRFEQLLGNLDAQVGNVSIRNDVEKIWTKLQTPFEIGQFGFLKLNPQSLGLSAFQGQNNQLFTRIELSAFPNISSDNAASSTPLPDLTTPRDSNTFNIQCDLHASTDSLSQVLSEAIVGKSMKIGYRKFIVKNSTVISLSGNKVALKIDFGGWRKGYLYLVGTPNVDATGAIISFPDLAFEAKTNSLLLNVAKWMLNRKITDMLRSRANFDFTPQLANVKMEATTQLNKPWGDNVTPTGALNEAKINAIYPLRNRILFRADLKGTLSITVGNPALSAN